MNAPLPLSVARQLSSRVRLRALAVGDTTAVLELLARHGHPARSRAGLHWALLDNPTRVAVGADAGWVLECGDGIAGFMGNLPLRCLKHGQAVWGATCTTPVVDTDVRAHGIRLLRAFAAQPGASFLYARPATQALATAWRSLAFEVDGHLSDGAVLHWPLGRTSIRATRMGSRPLCHLPNWVRRLAGSDPAEPSHSRSCGLRIQRLSADELAGTCPGPWPQIWNAWANRFWSRPGLWTERSAYLMSWRLADPDMAGRLGLWVVHDGAATMLGMALARLRPAEEQGSASAELLDWALLPQAPAACSQLLLDAVKHWALSGHACRLEAAGFSGEAAQQLHALAPQHLEHDVGELLVLQTPQDMSLEALQAESGERPLLPPWNSTGCEHADWFYTGLTKTPELTSTWHPARAARVYPAPRPPDRAPVVTNSACASR